MAPPSAKQDARNFLFFSSSRSKSSDFARFYLFVVAERFRRDVLEAMLIIEAQKSTETSFLFLFPSSPPPSPCNTMHCTSRYPFLPFLSKILLHDQTDISPVIKYNLKFLSKKKNYTKNDRARWSQESHLEISILLLRITIVNRKIRENKRCPDSIRPIREHRASSSIAPSSGEARSTRAQFADATALSTQP